MPDLENNYNIYANLAQVAYPRGDASFSQELIIEKRHTPTQIIFPMPKTPMATMQARSIFNPTNLRQ